MRNAHWLGKLFVLCTFGGTASVVAAQDQGAGVGGGGSVGGAASIEGGDVDTGGSASGGASAPASSSAPTYASDSGFEEPSSGSSDARLGVQLRLDALNMIGVGGSINLPGPGGPILIGGPIEVGIGPSVPLATPGVRFVDGKLFLGLGLGFVGGNNDTGGGGGGADRGQSGFSLSPLVSYDVLSDAVAALHLVGWFNIASLGEEEDCNAAGVCSDDPNSDASGLGLNLGAGVRGKLSEGLAIGGEFGWGFMSGSVGPVDYFNHGLFGTLLFEASVGL